MKKIFKAIGSIIKGILGNLDYLAAFAIGVVVQKHAPEQLETVVNGISTFDYQGALDATVNFGKATWDLGVQLVDYVAALIEGAPADAPAE